MRILIDFITVFVRKDFLEEAEFDISFSYHRSHKFLKKLLKEMRRGKKTILKTVNHSERVMLRWTSKSDSIRRRHLQDVLPI